MTHQEEAKTKWCPFVRWYTFMDAANPYAFNNRVTSGEDFYKRPEDQLPTTRCIASECMAWRWVPVGPHDTGNNGYCGLAGSPTP